MIRGLWATDNAGLEILLNGALTGNQNPNGFTGSAYFEISAAMGDVFVDGVNSLVSCLNNAPRGASVTNPTGIRVEMMGLAAIPEPSTVALASFVLSVLIRAVSADPSTAPADLIAAARHRRIEYRSRFLR